MEPITSLEGLKAALEGDSRDLHILIKPNPLRGMQEEEMQEIARHISYLLERDRIEVLQLDDFSSISTRLLLPEQFSGTPSLRVFEFTNSSADSEEDMVVLTNLISQSPFLLHLSLERNNPLFTNTNIEPLANALSRFTFLRKLNLRENTLSHENARQLAGALPQLKNLQELYLGDCTALRDVTYAANISADENIPLQEYLDLAATREILEATTQMPHLKTLHFLQIPGLTFDEIEQLVTQASLQELGFTINHNISHEQFLRMGNILSQQSHIQRLVIGNQLNEPTLLNLVKTLAPSNFLQTLVLPYMLFESPDLFKNFLADFPTFTMIGRVKKEGRTITKITDLGRSSAITIGGDHLLIYAQMICTRKDLNKEYRDQLFRNTTPFLKWLLEQSCNVTTWLS